MSDHSEVNVRCQFIEDEDPADAKRRIQDQQRQALEAWSHHPDDMRQALVVMTQDVLGQLLINPDQWLPHAARPIEGGGVEVGIRFTMEHINEAIVRLRAQAERRQAEGIDFLLQIREEM